jgi:hypothetical protein
MLGRQDGQDGQDGPGWEGRKHIASSNLYLYIYIYTYSMKPRARAEGPGWHRRGTQPKGSKTSGARGRMVGGSSGRASNPRAGEPSRHTNRASIACTHSPLTRPPTPKGLLDERCMDEVASPAMAAPVAMPSAPSPPPPACEAAQHGAARRGTHMVRRAQGHGTPSRWAAGRRRGAQPAPPPQGPPHQPTTSAGAAAPWPPHHVGGHIGGLGRGPHRGHTGDAQGCHTRMPHEEITRGAAHQGPIGPRVRANTLTMAATVRAFASVMWHPLLPPPPDACLASLRPVWFAAPCGATHRYMFVARPTGRGRRRGPWRIVALAWLSCHLRSCHRMGHIAPFLEVRGGQGIDAAIRCRQLAQV